jgi:mRNA interferase MazF
VFFQAPKKSANSSRTQMVRLFCFAQNQGAFKMNNKISRGDIFYANLKGNIGSEQGGIRPVLIVQNDIGNKHSPTTIIAPITSKQMKSKLPTHVELTTAISGLPLESIALTEQIRVIDKTRLKEKFGCVLEKDMKYINAALRISVGV